MSETFTKVIKTQEKEIASLKEEITLLKEEVASQGKALDSNPTVIDMDALLEENESLVGEVLSKNKVIETLQVEQVEPTSCEIHGVKECTNLKCIPTEVAEE